MKFKNNLEKVLYWIYKAPTLYHDNPYTERTTVKILLQDMSYAHEFARQGKKEARKAWERMCRDPENLLRYFQEMGVLSCELCADLDNVHLKKMSPVQAVNKYRKVSKTEE